MTIRKIETEQEKRRFATYDFEWFPHSLQLRICGLYDGKTYRHTTTIDDFLAMVLTKEFVGVWLYAHAGGMADFAFLLGWLLRSDKYEVSARFSGSAAVHVEIKNKAAPDETWILVDSFFLLRAPLRKIMKSLGREKGGDNDSLDQFYVSLAELKDYNENDCTGLYLAIERFQEEIIGLNGEMMPTIASTAMRLFRRAYLKDDIRTLDGENRLLRESYIASRVEVFKKGGEDLFQYDINSSFPSSMTEPAPGELRSIGRRLPPQGDCFFADVTVKIPEMDIPPLPYRHAGKVFFPTGSWRRWMSGVDVRLAQEKGKIVQVHEVHQYTERLDMRDYVFDIYERRKNSKDEFQREVYKILLNAVAASGPCPEAATDLHSTENSENAMKSAA